MLINRVTEGEGGYFVLVTYVCKVCVFFQSVVSLPRFSTLNRQFPLSTLVTIAQGVTFPGWLLFTQFWRRGSGNTSVEEL